MPIIGLQTRTLHVNLLWIYAQSRSSETSDSVPPKFKSSSPYNSSQISKNHQHSKPPLRQEVPAPENLLWLSTFSEDNPAGCIRCYCNGVSDECRAAKGWTIRNKELELTWRVNGGASEARYSQSISPVSEHTLSLFYLDLFSTVLGIALSRLCLWFDFC